MNKKLLMKRNNFFEWAMRNE